MLLWLKHQPINQKKNQARFAFSEGLTPSFLLIINHVGRWRGLQH